METPEGARTFLVPGDNYDKFMGRYSRHLAREFVSSIPLTRGDTALDIGCGPGALTGVLVETLGSDAVSVVDPSPPFLAACLARYPQVTGKLGRAENIPYDDNAFDAVLAQLVLLFVTDLPSAGREMIRVAKPGGLIAACTWDVDEMEMLALFWRAAAAITGEPPADRAANRFAGKGHISSYFETLGLTDVSELPLSVQADYQDFDDLWDAYQQGIGPVGAWCVAQNNETQAALKAEIFKNLGSPTGSFTLKGQARMGSGRTPTWPHCRDR